MRNAARVVALAATVAIGLGVPAATAWAAEEGPDLQVPRAALEQSLTCRGDLEGAPLTPVLLIPGTTQTPEEFSFNYIPAFEAEGRPVCTVELPKNAGEDIQISAEYVVSAVRTMSDRAGRQIDIVGHSQGGMISRWAFKYWPDTRDAVDDMVGLAPSNHGTVVASAVCAAGGCSPAIHQQRPDSRFYAALNDGPETFPGVDYTVVTTNFDEVVVPNVELPAALPDAAPPASSPLRGGGANVRNVNLQNDLCPVHVADHLTIALNDAPAYAVAVDALDHEGPADLTRVDRAVCGRLFAPGVDPVTFPTDLAKAGAVVTEQLTVGPRVFAEPETASYAEPA